MLALAKSFFSTSLMDCGNHFSVKQFNKDYSATLVKNTKQTQFFQGFAKMNSTLQYQQVSTWSF